MANETYKATIQQWVKEAWNAGDFSSVSRLYPANYVLHDPSAPAPIENPDALGQMIRTFRAAMPDFQMHIERMVGEGDFVAWQFLCTGTQSGPFMTIPPTNRQVSISGTVTSRFEGEKWVEDWVNWDALGYFQQLGVIPPLG